MIDNPTPATMAATNASTTEGPQDIIHFMCRLLSAMAWIAIVLWIVAPRGTRWADSAGDAGLAWILFTGGGYFAEQTVRSFIDLWKAFPNSCNPDVTGKNQEHCPR